MSGETVTISIVDRAMGAVSLYTSGREYWAKYRRVMMVAIGEWLRAYEATERTVMNLSPGPHVG